MEYRSILIFMHPFAQVAPVPARVGVAGFVRWPVLPGAGSPAR
ncbi:hypothetical protein Deipr_1723 [Deinococcus proteolyticus MRP]|uniref:Uncharacterized protein n=1 Tax=Deinococcus proteolyticus (strain ATCC 35074 / DSM 20540 / JCM 6276 / NBRC 101906 / NCIMB 13154 / VKM Ac-1939 / CCM 2703 / MRP) TaxID=693977 RepID=F0RL65_DEIPM|nr:hypothetical protein Deipr_1723 [Deinococcus proteolyticus MRP]